MQHVALRATLLVGLSFCLACSRPHYYDWGSYSSSVYQLYNDPENYILDNDLQQLATEVEKTPRPRIPPGKAAHIGFLYATKGDTSNAVRYFELEKSLFPESTVLMDRLIKKSREKAL